MKSNINFGEIFSLMVQDLFLDNEIMSRLEKFGVKDKFDNPKVSVIVPTYNNEKYLPKCLLSLIEQTLKDIEIIIINDGSTDNTAQILSLFQEYDSRIKVITNETNKKQGISRNIGTKAAQGEFIGYVDSDDWVDIEYFEKLYNAAKKYNSDIALATNVRIGNGKTKKRLNITEEVFVTGLQNKIDICNQAKNPCPTNKIYKKQMLSDNHIIWPENVYCEDKLYTMQAIYYANGIVTVPNINYYYYRNLDSTVNKKSKSHIKKFKEDKNAAYLSVLNFLKEKNTQVRDKEFWAVTDILPSEKFPLIKIKQSLHTVKYYLFGFVKIFEKRI